MYTVSVRDEERFYLRLLLLHVHGVQSFEELRTFKGNLYPTFKAAATVRGLLESDEEWDRCLRDAAIYQMPKELRNTFAVICVFCPLQNPLELWLKYAADMTLDYARVDHIEIATNKALHDIESVLKQHGSSCSKIGLQVPVGTTIVMQEFDRMIEEQRGEVQLAMLNDRQLNAFNEIISAIDNDLNENRCFYLDGPGGSGKTFLYTTLMPFIRGKLIYDLL